MIQSVQKALILASVAAMALGATPRVAEAQANRED